MFPIIPILACLAIFGGGATLLWYDALSKEDKTKANRLTGEYALALFNKTVSQLTKAEAKTVHDRVKAHFQN